MGIEHRPAFFTVTGKQHFIAMLLQQRRDLFLNRLIVLNDEYRISHWNPP